MTVELWHAPWPPSSSSSSSSSSSLPDRDRSAAFARRVLARYTAHADAAAPRWTIGPHGKPGPVLPRGPHWNLSHSGEHALLAVGWEGPLGVDIQRLDTRVDPVAAARRFFGAAEAEQVAAAEDPRRAYHRALCRKEAWAKAEGRRLLDVLRLTPDAVLDLDAPAGYVAALAVTAGPAAPRVLRHVLEGHP